LFCFVFSHASFFLSFSLFLLNAINKLVPKAIYILTRI
jgi:hypothetical protein